MGKTPAIAPAQISASPGRANLRATAQQLCPTYTVLIRDRGSFCPPKNASNKCPFSHRHCQGVLHHKSSIGKP